MPPLQIVLVGLLFKITGVSLIAARYFSMVCVLGSFYSLVYLGRQFKLGLYTPILATIFLLGSDFVAVGNSARMDAFLGLVLCVGFVQIARQRWGAGLALLLTGPLIHPNGAYFLLGGLIWFVLSGTYRHWKEELWIKGRYWIALSLLLWLASILLSAFHWNDFLRDMAFQFERKLGRNHLGNIFNFRNALIALVFYLLFRYRQRLKIESLWLMSLGFPCWAANILGRERWYGLYGDFFGLLFSLLVLDGFRRWMVVTERFKPTTLRYIIMPLALVLVFVYGLNQGRLGKYRFSPDQLEWQDMRVATEVAYLTHEDMELLRAKILALPGYGNLAVQFFPRGDGILFYEYYPHDWTYTNPLFYRPKVDLQLIHLSRYFPGEWKRRVRRYWSQIGVNPDSLPEPVYTRDSTEQWYLIETGGIGFYPTGMRR